MNLKALALIGIAHHVVCDATLHALCIKLVHLSEHAIYHGISNMAWHAMEALRLQPFANIVDPFLLDGSDKPWLDRLHETMISLRMRKCARRT